MTHPLTMPTWAYLVTAAALWLAGYVAGRRHVDRDLRAAQRLAHDYQVRLVAMAARDHSSPYVSPWRYVEKPARDA